MIPADIYNVYQVRSDGANIHYRLVAKIQYGPQGTLVLIDTTQMFSEGLPDGPMTPQKERFLRVALSWSHYRWISALQQNQPSFSVPL